MASDWTPRLLAITNAISDMGTFQEPATSDLADLTWGEWQLERARRIAAAIDKVDAPAAVTIPDEVREAIEEALSCWTCDIMMSVMNGFDRPEREAEINMSAKAVRKWLDAQPKGEKTE